MIVVGFTITNKKAIAQQPFHEIAGFGIYQNW